MGTVSRFILLSLALVGCGDAASRVPLGGKPYSVEAAKAAQGTLRPVVVLATADW